MHFCFIHHKKHDLVVAFKEETKEEINLWKEAGKVSVCMWFT